MRLGANIPYDINPDAVPSVLHRLSLLKADQVLVPSHTPAWVLDDLLAALPNAMYHVRVKGNKKWWPGGTIDAREWASEPTPRETILHLLSRTRLVNVVLWNEPCLELTADYQADNPVQRESAWSSYVNAAASVISILKRDIPEVGIALAPLSAGTPERFNWWLTKYLGSGLLTECTYVAEHCYTNGLQYSDLDWGSRYIRFMLLGKPIHILEANANDHFSDNPTQLAEHLSGYVAYLNLSKQVEVVSLFTLAGGINDATEPQWWFLPDQVLQACGSIVRSSPVPEVPVPQQPLTLSQVQQLAYDVDYLPQPTEPIDVNSALYKYWLAHKEVGTRASNALLLDDGRWAVITKRGMVLIWATDGSVTVQ